MSLTKTLIAEIEHESAGTRKILERIPQDKFDWKPHPKSNSLKALASHVAGLSSWPGVIAKTDHLDLASLKGAEINSTEDLVKEFDNNIKQALDTLRNTKDEELSGKWSLRKGDHVIAELPKAVSMRSIALSHLYHHRAQLSVYLRLLDVPVPGMYGPSADEK